MLIWLCLCVDLVVSVCVDLVVSECVDLVVFVCVDVVVYPLILSQPADSLSSNIISTC